jgi:hypothetical protein
MALNEQPWEPYRPAVGDPRPELRHPLPRRRVSGEPLLMEL